MNLLPFAQNSLVKSLPIHTPRSNLIKKLLLANSAIFGIYLISSGPYKMTYNRKFTAGPESGFESLAYFHFAHNSIPQFLFTSGIFYTLGNYHVTKYGCSSFMRLFGLAAAGGSLLTAAGLFSGST